MKTLFQEDKSRYPNTKMPAFQRFWRKAQMGGTTANL